MAKEKVGIQNSVERPSVPHAGLPLMALTAPLHVEFGVVGSQ